MSMPFVMTFIAATALAITGCASTSLREEAQPGSCIPRHCVERFVYERLDLSSFRNSLGPARDPGMQHFRDFGIKPARIEPGILEMETADWLYVLEILDRGDFNRDGLEDLVIGFYDSARGGSYRTFNRYLVTCYSSDSGLVAIAFEPPGGQCGEGRVP